MENRESKGSRWKEFLSGLRTGERLPGKNQLLIIFLIGVLLLVIVFPMPESGSAEPGGTGSGENREKEAQTGTQAAVSGESYEEYLEEKTARILQEVEGAGEVTVMITLKSTGQKIVEKDQSSSSQTTQEADSSGGIRTTEDTFSEKSSVYEQGSDGSQSPYVSKELTPEIEGVVVIADGGDNAVVVQNITGAVQALFGVEAHKIKIMKRADT